MVYTRSSYLTWLSEKHDCNIIPLDEKGTLRIWHGPMKSHMRNTKHIDYIEIFMHHQKLWLPELPTESDLVRVE